MQASLFLFETRTARNTVAPYRLSRLNEKNDGWYPPGLSRLAAFASPTDIR
jgi:hypothetical protein